MIQEDVHKKIIAECDAVCAWFEKLSVGLKFPITSSFDIRDSGYKVAPVDANIFPAGFNNTCSVDKENAPEIMKSYLRRHYPHLQSARIGLLAEEHTGNSFYWENVATLSEIIKAAGHEVIVFVPSVMATPKTITTPKQQTLQIYGTDNRNGEIYANNTQLDFIVCNNDFSIRPEGWMQHILTPANPPLELGWYQRRKNNFFAQYNLLAKEFAQLIDIHPSALQIETELFSQFDSNDRDVLEELAKKVDQFLSRLKKSYSEQGVQNEPFCYVKNNMGTYGLGVVQVHSGDEILNWNSKTRSKMKASKGGNRTDSVIIQEGIPTRFKDDTGATAEPCIYMVGEQLVGGFLRTHAEKSDEESLNSPGAVFKRLCVSDLELNMPGCPMENVYGWTSKLSVLSLAREAKAAGVSFKSYVEFVS